MAFRFKGANAIAVGSFNIYVIQPKWLTEVGLLPAGTKAAIQTDLIRPGFKYSIDGEQLAWDVRPDRLTVMSGKPGVNCGEIVANVLDRLPWTPLMGVGVNFEYAGEFSDLDSIKDGCGVPSCEPPNGYSLGQSSSHIALLKEGQAYNLQLPKTENAELSVNIHTDLNPKAKQESINKIAQDVLRRFFDDRLEAERLIHRLFGPEITYEQHSN